MPNIYTKSGGGWALITNAYIKSGGVWSMVTNAWHKIGGVWISLFVALSNYPQPFSVYAATKAYPSSSQRLVSVSWSQSTNAIKYELQVQGSNDNSAWTMLQAYSSSPFINEPTRSATYSAAAYTYYQVSVRASTLAGNTINSDSGGYYQATGSPPGIPTSISGFQSGSQALIYYTNTTSPGSNLLSGVQYSVDSVSSWSATQTTSPISIPGLTDGSHTVYLRSINADGIVSSNGSTTFTITTAIIPTISGITYSSIDSSSFIMSWNSTNQSSYLISGSLSYSGTTQTSVGFTGLSPGTTYSGTITVTSSTGHTASTSWSVTTSSAVIPTISGVTYSNVDTSSFIMSWSSTNQLLYSIEGSFMLNGTTQTSVGFTGLSPGTTYSGTITVTSSTGHTASTSWSVTTAAFVTPTAPAPSMTWLGISGGGQDWSWNAVSATGSGTVNGYGWEISESPGGPLLSYGTNTGTTLHTNTTAVRWARVRAQILGTDSNIYYGSWSNWA